MLRRAGRKPVLAAWKLSFRSTAALPRPSFEPEGDPAVRFVFALSGHASSEHPDQRRARRPFAFTVTVTRRPLVALTSFVASFSRVRATVPPDCLASENCCPGPKSPMFLSSSWAATRHQNVPPARYVGESSVGA